jgi:hypothetical protein
MNPGEISHAEQGRQSLLQYLAAAEMALHGGLQIHGFGPVAPAHMERAMAHIREAHIAIRETKAARSVAQLVAERHQSEPAMAGVKRKKCQRV